MSSLSQARQDFYSGKPTAAQPSTVPPATVTPAVAQPEKPLSRAEVEKRFYGTSTGSQPPAAPSNDRLSVSEALEGASTAKGDLEIKLPEGATVADAATFGEFKKLATEAGITADAASKLVAWDTARQVKQNEAWGKELAGEPEVLAAAMRVFRRHGGAELARDLSELGLGNLPSLVRFLAAIDEQ